MTDIRGVVLSRLRAELFGPAGSENETVTGRPYWRYLCGMLFPVELSSEELDQLQALIDRTRQDKARKEKSND